MTWEPGALLELETERLRLCSLAREDVTERFLSWMADPEVMVGLNLPRRRMTRAQAVKWVLGYDNRRTFGLGMELKGVGLVGFFTLTCDLKNAIAETAVVIGEQGQWGKNLVIEGRSRIMDFLFDDMAMHKVIGRPHGRNISSIYNYKAMGFECEAVLREQTVSIKEGDGRLDQLVFGMLRDEWVERRKRMVSKT